MIAKKYRLTSSLIDFVFKKGAKVSSCYFLLIFLKNTDNSSRLPIEKPLQFTEENASRFAIAVSKKISPSAVIRNSLRRTIYRILQKHFHEIKSGYHVLIITKQTFINIPHSIIEQEILGILNKSRLM